MTDVSRSRCARDGTGLQNGDRCDRNIMRAVVLKREDVPSCPRIYAAYTDRAGSGRWWGSSSLSLPREIGSTRLTCCSRNISFGTVMLLMSSWKLIKCDDIFHEITKRILNKLTVTVPDYTGQKQVCIFRVELLLRQTDLSGERFVIFKIIKLFKCCTQNS